MVVWLASCVARLFALPKSAAAYVPARVRIARRPLRRRTIDL